MTEINLETGEVHGDEKGTGRPIKEGSRRTEKERAADRRKYREKKLAGGSGAKADQEVASRTERVLGRLADRRDSHGDLELGQAIREDGPTIAQGVADVTKAVPPLRIPLLLILGVIEPAIAFLRVGGILARRLNERRVVAPDEMPPEETAPLGGVVVDEFGRPLR